MNNNNDTIMDNKSIRVIHFSEINNAGALVMIGYCVKHFRVLICHLDCV